MNTNKGIFAEEEMALLFNDKKFLELSNNSKHIIRTMFGHVEDNDVIKCSRLDNAMKPDLSFTINNVTHYLSMKTGSNGIVHQEKLDFFCDHLKEIGISDRTIETIRLYHYGDKTTDGTGEERFSFRRVVFALDARIQEANKELNQNRDFVVHMLNRFLFKGREKENITAEFIYHGDKEFGVIVTRKQVLMHIKLHTYEFLENLHIGPLLIHPHARYVGKKTFNKEKRSIIEFHWPNLFTALRKISYRYNGGIE
ncbi:MAG: hypothetical protein K5906_02985 [Bacilli bacterium]|nr:hypothetical protein [Bacilli bacterium]